jgi:hypothetical protein
MVATMTALNVPWTSGTSGVADVSTRSPETWSGCATTWPSA